MKQTSTLLLRIAVLAIGAAVLALCIFVLPIGISQEKTGEYGPILWGLYATALPFFVAVYQTLRLLTYIDKNKAFSELSVKTLARIKYCAFIISGAYAVGMPYIYFVANNDDAPGVLLIGLIIAFASFVIATLAAVLQKLLQGAVDMKTENDLTV